jgi:hypothetical protein
MIKGPWTVEFDDKVITVGPLKEPFRYCPYCATDQYQHDEAAYIGHMLREHDADLYPDVDGLPTPWPCELLLGYINNEMKRWREP